MTFNLGELHDFPANLIMKAQPESSIARLVDQSRKIDDTIYYESMQYVDYFNAYIYAQNNIIGANQRDIKSINPLDWLEHIININSFMGHTILATNETKAGEYASEDLVIWSYGADMDVEIEEEIIKNPQLNIQIFSSHIAHKYGVPELDIREFLELTIPVYLSSSGAMASSGLEFIKQYKPFYKVISKFFNNICDEEQKIKILKIARPTNHTDIHTKMLWLADKIYNRLQNITTNHATLIPELSAEIGLDLILIHPFANANGRTALCLMNTLFVAFNLPCITFGTSNEVNNPNNTFFKIITAPHPNPNDFISFIQQRLKLNEFSEPLVDDLSQRILKLRIDFCILYKKIKNNYQAFKVDDFNLKHQDKFIEQIWPELLKNMSIEEVQNLNDNIFTYHYFVYLLGELHQYQRALTISLTNLSLHNSVYNNKEWAEIKNKFIDVTKVDNGWKVYKKQNTIIFTPANQEQLQKVFNNLKELDSCAASIATLKDDPKCSVIKIVNMDLTKLQSMQIEDDINEQRMQAHI